MSQSKKRKLLLFSYNPLSQSIAFAKALSKYFDDIKVVAHETDSQEYFGQMHDFPIYKEDYDKYKVTNFHYANNYDVVLGLDQQCLPIMAGIKNTNPNIVVGAQILDYPAHTFINNKDYNELAYFQWCTKSGNFTDCLSQIDFVFHNQDIALKCLQQTHPEVRSAVIKYPVNPIFCSEKRKDHIVYSGRVSPDKGVHYVIEALSLLDIKIPLVVIGGNGNLSEYAQYLHVPYKQVSCSELEKWKLYHEARFLVCGADNPNIPALSILEGISINRTGVVFDYPEGHLHYKDFVYYTKPQDIAELSSVIKYLWMHQEDADAKAVGGFHYYRQECSYEAWAKNIYDGIISCYG